MKILHITTYLHAGAGKILCNLAMAQKQMGHCVIVVTSLVPETEYCNYTEYLLQLEKGSIPVIAVDSTFKRDIYRNVSASQCLREILSANDIDVIHAHAAVPALIGILGRGGLSKYIPVIQTGHGWGLNKKQEHEKMDAAIMNGLDCVVAISKSEKELFIRKGVQSDKIQIVYNGIDTKKPIEVDDNDIKEIRQLIDEGYTIVGCIGTVCKRKNQELLLHALKEIVCDYKVLGVFIGEGELDHLTYLQNLSNEFGIASSVRFYGYKENGSSFFKYFNYLIMPSKSEGLPLVIIEAFKEKILVLGSDIPPIAEIVGENDAGLLFTSEDPKSLSSCLRKALEMPDDIKEDIINKGYNVYENLFTLEAMVDNYFRIYAMYAS